MPTRWKVDKWTSGQVCITSERGLICTMESGNEETRKADAAQIVREHNAYEVNERARLALEGLTPGGSEYVNDPARCVAYVQRIKTDCVEAHKDNVRIRRANEAMREALEHLINASIMIPVDRSVEWAERTSKEAVDAVDQARAALRQAKGD